MKPTRSRTSPRRLAASAAVAALYTVLTLLSAPLSMGPLQFRLSEMLAVLPVFTPTSVPGLFIGCLLSNLLLGAPIYDLLFGSLATLLGALGAAALRRFPFLSPLPTILANTLILPPILRFAYGLQEAYWILFLSVGLGETVCAGLFGIALLFPLQKHRRHLFSEIEY